MVNLQFYRGWNQEVIVYVEDVPKSFKQIDLGYPLLSFVDCKIDIIGDTVSHIYWALPDVQNSNIVDAMHCQSNFRTIFDDIPPDGQMDIKLFEKAAVKYAFEIPLHSISKQMIDNRELTVDIYRCINLPGTFVPIVEQLCIAELHFLVTNGYVIKKCANCGKLFVPRKSDEKYCIRKSRLYPNMNCKQEAKYRKQLERESADESSVLYHRIYTKLSKRTKTAPAHKQAQAQDDLYRFMQEGLRWKEIVKAHPEQRDSYIQWLRTQ